MFTKRTFGTWCEHAGAVQAFLLHVAPNNKRHRVFSCSGRLGTIGNLSKLLADPGGLSHPHPAVDPGFLQERIVSKDYDGEIFKARSVVDQATQVPCYVAT